MIERLAIENFQRHESLDIVLDPAITAITGSSDAGKSSILRAMKWLATNRPLGDGMVRVGADRCRVRMLVDGKTLTRTRDGQENAYAVGKRGYRAFGGDVPSDVTGLLNMTDANWQGQHDPPFWFSLSPGEVARQLNKIVDLELIDGVSSRLGGLARRSKAERDVVGERLGKAKERLETYATVPRMDEQLSGLEEMGNRLADLVGRTSRLDGILMVAKRTAGEWKELRSKFLDANDVIEIATRWGALQQRIEAMCKLIRDADAFRRALSFKVPDMKLLDGLKGEMERSIGRYRKLEALLMHAKEVSSDMDDLIVELKEAEEKLKEDTGGVCPLCGGRLIARERKK